MLALSECQWIAVGIVTAKQEEHVAYTYVCSLAG